jgi:transcriptional regulator with XRE-family HTH domain
MDVEQRNAALIDRINQARIEKGLAYQRISDRMEAAGFHVSASTVRRILAGEAPAATVRYEEVLKPMAEAVLGIGFDVAPSQSDDDKYQQVISYYESELDHWHKFYGVRLDEETAKLQAAIRQLDIAQLDFHKKDRQIFWLWAALCIIFLALVILLAVDVIDPNWGLLLNG